MTSVLVSGTLVERAKARRQADVLAARKSAAAFIEFAFRHEKTGRIITNGHHHREWHEFFDQNRRGVLFAPVEHGKTIQIAVGRVLFKLGVNPSLRIAIVSNTEKQAVKVLSLVKEQILRNQRVQEVFPHLRPSPHGGWGANSITIERPTLAKDPSIQALGVAGPLVGSRVDVLVLDDVLDLENTRTAEQREKLLDWYESTAQTRVTADGEVWAIGTPWAADDLYHELEKRPGYASRRYSAAVNPDDKPEAWRPLWPEQFSNARLVDLYLNTTPGNFARKYLCRVRLDLHSRFQQAWLDATMANGKGWRMFDRAPQSGGKAWPTFTGVDLGVGEGAQHDLTVLFTIAIEPGTRRRWVVDVQSGRWQAPDIINRIMDVYRRFNSIVVVESNAAQRFLVQFAHAGGLPVRPYYTTGQAKYDEHFGVESIAVEMRSGLWAVPSGVDGQTITTDVREWFREMLFYDPASHTGDRLMASWFAREAARNYAPDLLFSRHDVQAR